MDIFAPFASSRFLVSVFTGLVPSPLDLRFERASGMDRQVSSTAVRQGGENIANLYLPDRVDHGTLVLERGVTAWTPLTYAFSRMFDALEIPRLTVIVMLLNDVSVPMSSWVIRNAVPLRWSTGDLDANSNRVLIDRMELGCSRINRIGLVA